MTSNTFKKGASLQLHIESLAYGGLGIARHQNIVFFVKNALPGQTVIGKIIKKKKKYFECIVEKTIHQSGYTIEPKCLHFYNCGGCSFQNFNYKQQLIQKEIQIQDLFQKIGDMKKINITKIVPAKEIYHYRNKMDFTFSNKRWLLKNDSMKKPKDFALGLHISGRYDKILDIDNCLIQDEYINDILNEIKTWAKKNNLSPYDLKRHSGFLRHVVFRKSNYMNNIMVNLVTTIYNKNIMLDFKKMIIKKFNKVSSIINTINNKKAAITIGEEQHLVYGKKSIIEKIDSYLFEISADSFFQTNSNQTKKLYDIIKDECQLSGKEIVYDMFCGTGTIGIYIAKHSKSVFGFEIVSDAIKDAKKNAKINQIKNIKFYCVDITKHIGDYILSQKINFPDIIILDPPRAGLNLKIINALITLNAKKIIYTSCNPATAARDIKILCENNFSLKKINPIDMFPHTPHIEIVCVLTQDNN